MITCNQEFSLPGMTPCVIEKFCVIVFVYRDKKVNLELEIHLTGNFENSKL